MADAWPETTSTSKASTKAVSILTGWTAISIPACVEGSESANDTQWPPAEKIGFTVQ
jgi:hypothetical protein